MKMTVEARLKAMCSDGVKIGVSIDHDRDHKNLIPEFYIAILKAMRDSHVHEFHKAMTEFIGEELANE